MTSLPSPWEADVTAALAILTLASFLLLFAGVGMAIKHRNPFWVLPFWIFALLVESLAEMISGHPGVGILMILLAFVMLIAWAVVIVIQAHIIQRRSEAPQEPPEDA
jgi:hypothetical protein